MKRKRKHTVGLTPHAKLGAYYLAARRGDLVAAKRLFAIASYSTYLLEELFHKDPKLVKELTRGHDEFPVLRSWAKDYNDERDRMIRKLDLGSSLPLRAKKSADEFYRRVTEEMIPYVGLYLLEGKIPLPPLSADPSVCRQWAKAIVDRNYPDACKAAADIYIDPVDWRAAKKAAERSCASRQKRRKATAAPADSEIRKLVKEERRAVMEKTTVGDFRTGLIDKVADKLMRAVKNEPWHFHGFSK